MKRCLSIILIFAAIASFSACPPTARAGFANFKYMQAYTPGRFSDVNEPDWYARYVADAYNYGFFRGIDADVFDPHGSLAFSEAMELIARLNSAYSTGPFPARSSVHTSAPERRENMFADYALENGFISIRSDFSAPATRLQFAQLVCAVLPPEALQIINSIPDYGICDVVAGMGFEDDVYYLYRTGILAGADQYGTFSPGQKITRAEACAVLVRLIDPLARINAVPPTAIPADVIYQRCMDAVFLLETFDSEDASIRTGTGFFINSIGYAVTNLHVIDNAANAEVTLSSGGVFPVLGVVASSEEYNLVIFSVDLSANAGTPGSAGARQSYLKLSDSDLAVAGSAIYALGNPLAFVHTITNGIVANAYREVDGNIFFQFTAPISFGSGGSPVLNALGQVVGVASSSFSYGQNLNLAVPSNFIKELEIGKCIPLDEFLESRTTNAEAIEDTEDIEG